MSRSQRLSDVLWRLAAEAIAGVHRALHHSLLSVCLYYHIYLAKTMRSHHECGHGMMQNPSPFAFLPFFSLFVDHIHPFLTLAAATSGMNGF